MNDNTRAIEKVRKLLALANDRGASENEAQTAMRQAHAMMAKHAIELADLAERDDERHTSISVHPGYRWAREITMSIANLYMCRMVYWSSKHKNQFRFQFIGNEANVAIAAEIARFVVMSIKREGARGRRRHGSVWMTSFLHGASHRINTRCWDLVEQAKRGNVEGVERSKALVLASVYDREQELNAAFLDQMQTKKTKQRTIYIRDTDGYRSGQAAGDRAELQRKVADC